MAPRDLLDTGPPPENERAGARAAADPSKSIVTGINDRQIDKPADPPPSTPPRPMPPSHSDFDWSTDGSVIIAEQPETALYWNDREQLVIRQRRWPNDDSFVFFNKVMLPHLIFMLQAEADA